MAKQICPGHFKLPQFGYILAKRKVCACSGCFFVNFLMRRQHCSVQSTRHFALFICQEFWVQVLQDFVGDALELEF